MLEYWLVHQFQQRQLFRLTEPFELFLLHVKFLNRSMAPLVSQTVAALGHQFVHFHNLKVLCSYYRPNIPFIVPQTVFLVGVGTGATSRFPI